MLLMLTKSKHSKRSLREYWISTLCLHGVFSYAHYIGGAMKIIQRGKKWVLYDDDGKIIVMSSDRKICERIMKECQ